MEEKQLVNLVGAGNTESQEKIEKPTLSFTQDVWRRLKKINWRPYHFGFQQFYWSFQLDQISLLMPRMLIILMVMKLRHIVIYHLNYQIAYHSGMVVLSFQVIRSLMMCTLINQFQKTINLFWELTI